MQDLLELGPLVVDRRLLTGIAALAGGGAAIRFSRPRLGAASAPVLELLLPGALLVLLVWKFGHLLFHPSLLWERPKALLLMSGSAREALLGLAAAGVWLVLRARRAALPLRLLLDVTAYGAAVALALYSALQWQYGRPTDWPWGITDGIGTQTYHPLNVYVGLLASGAAVRAAWAAPAGSGRMFRDTAVLLGAGGLLISLFADGSGSRIFYLTPIQLVCLASALAGVIFSTTTHNTE